MADLAGELLDACRVAEDIWVRLPHRTTSLRKEIDALWEAYEQALSSGSELMNEDVAAVVALSHGPSALGQVPQVDVRTEVLLRAWRDAEHSLACTDPGTLAWLLANRAVEAARDAYHARVNAIQAERDDGRDLLLSDLDDSGARSRAL